jgi:nitrite reductase/ring-hydroxylating ferredoxin subunit
MRKIVLLFIGISFLFTPSCTTTDPFGGDCFVPEVAVNATLNLNLPEYFHLQNIGQHLTLDAGNRGILVIHNYDDAFYAVERTCTYLSDRECSFIQVDSLNLQLRCGTYADTGFVQCCTSLFQLDGRLVNGPAQCNLKTYRTSFSGNVLNIGN